MEKKLIAEPLTIVYGWPPNFSFTPSQRSSPVCMSAIKCPEANQPAADLGFLAPDRLGNDPSVRQRDCSVPGACDPARASGRGGDRGGIAESPLAGYLCRRRAQSEYRHQQDPRGSGRLGGNPAICRDAAAAGYRFIGEVETPVQPAVRAVAAAGESKPQIASGRRWGRIGIALGITAIVAAGAAWYVLMAVPHFNLRLDANPGEFRLMRSLSDLGRTRI